MVNQIFKIFILAFVFLNLTLLVASDGTEDVSGECSSDAGNIAAGNGTAGTGTTGTQFISGKCTSDADCASGCCASKTGLCAARAVAEENGGSCGFNGQGPQGAPAPAPAGPASSGTAAGTQFITGPCTSDADCKDGCCGFNTGKCAGAVIAQQRDGGCGFGDAQPNDNAAQRLQGGRA